jgi:hypothetical protein
MRFAVVIGVLAALASCVDLAPAQAPLQRFFVLPDTTTAPGSDSQFSGTEGTTSYAFDFTEDLRFNRGGYVTLSPDPGNPYAWNVVDFKIPGTDLGLGSAVSFQRPPTPGTFGTWISSDPTGFPNLATVSVSMTGDFAATGPLAGVFPASTTLTASGTIVPGYFHNVILLTGSFAGIAGGSLSLFMKADFYPPAVSWEMVVRPSTSSAVTVLPPSSPSPVQGGFSMQRGISNPNVYALLNLALEVGASPPVAIVSGPGPNAGVLTFDPGTHGLTGSLNVLVDGVPATLTIDGSLDTFTGCVMHPTRIVIDESSIAGTAISSMHLEISTTELVPPEPAINDFQIGLTTSLAMRGRAGHLYGCAASLSALPGVNTPVGDIPVMPDDLLWLSIDPLSPFFSNMIGIMPPSGEALISVAIPNDPTLIGATFFLGGGTFDPGTLQVLAATNSHRATVKP